jgi:hypothetical protein
LVVQLYGPGTQVLRESQIMPAPQSLFWLQMMLGVHWLVVGWQKNPCAQSALVVHDPLAPGSHEWRAVSHVSPLEQSDCWLQNPPSVH